MCSSDLAEEVAEQTVDRRGRGEEGVASAVRLYEDIIEDWEDQGVGVLRLFPFMLRFSLSHLIFSPLSLAPQCGQFANSRAR